MKIIFVLKVLVDFSKWNEIIVLIFFDIEVKMRVLVNIVDIGN